MNRSAGLVGLAESPARRLPQCRWLSPQGRTAFISQAIPGTDRVLDPVLELPVLGPVLASPRGLPQHHFLPNWLTAPPEEEAEPD